MSDFLTALGDIFGSEALYGSAVRLGGFLAFAALGELVAEKAGTINISVEGSLLAGAFAGTVGYHATSNTVIGLVAAVGGGAVIALIQANMSHRLTADQFVVGMLATQPDN